MKKIWVVSTALLASVALSSGLVACSDAEDNPKQGTISVSVGSEKQVNGGTFEAVVGASYTITAKSSNSADVSVKYVFGSETTELTDSSFTPNASGKYEFTFTAKNSTDFKLTFDAKQGANTQSQYEVKFALGAHAAVDADEIVARVVANGSATTLPTAPKAASGYTFAGWNDGNTNYDASASYTVTGNVTFTAVWELEKYDVTYVLGAHAAATAKAPAAVSAVGNIKLPGAIAAETGYVFKGWSDGTTEYTANATYNVTGATTLTAVFEAINDENQNVTIEFELGEHAASTAQVPSSQTISIGSSFKLPAAPAAAEDYQFDGWSDGTETYAADADYTVKAAGTITATWKVKPAIQNGDFETGDLTGWTAVSGDIANVSVSSYSAYWEDNALYYDASGNTVLSVLKEGDNYLTTLEAGESNKVSVKSETFTLKGDGIISFKLGGAGNDDCYVALCAKNGAELLKITNQGFKDPGPAQAMFRHFMYANDYIGQEVYVKVVDNAASGFGFVEFDDLKVNLTVAQARAILAADKQWANNYYPEITASSVGLGGNAYAAIEHIRGYYRSLQVTDVTSVYFTQKVANQSVAAGTVNLTDYLTEAKGSMLGVQANSLTPSIVKVNDGATDSNTGFDSFALAGGKTYTVTYRLTDSASGKYAEATFTIVTFSAESNQILNGDFEEGDLSGWSIVEGAIDLTGGVSSLVHNDWVEHLPYNKSGNYFCFNAGLAEHAKWELRSSVFTLGGNGCISFKMASNSAFIKVFKADGTQVFYYTSKTFKDADFPHVEKGTGNWCTMRTHYADLSQYKGEKLYIQIGNLGVGGAWEFGYFDDIITYYAEGTNMTAKNERVTLTCTNSELSHAEGETWEVAWIKAENEL